MGRRHAEKVVALGAAGAPVRLAGVMDVLPERARGVASALGVRAARDAVSLFREADAAVVAVPTVHHYEVVRSALDSGLDVLVEKPIAETLAQGEALVDLVGRRSRVLHVGHLERFNSALRVVQGRILSPRFVEVQRIGRFPARGTDVDVVRDLMIHDIDLLQDFFGEEPREVEAIGVAVVTDKIDVANARLAFPSGCVANLTASRVASEPRRRMRLFQRDAWFSIDFLASSASIYRRENGAAPPRLVREHVECVPEDALLSQLRAFVDGVWKRDAPVRSAQSALGALRTALRVIDAMPRFEESP
jgi:predicted dehydrogenase